MKQPVMYGHLNLSVVMVITRYEIVPSQVDRANNVTLHLLGMLVGDLGIRMVVAIPVL
jgi:hypothetical protein